MPKELKIEYLPIDSIKPFKDNPRLIPDEALEKLKKSITAFGYTNPILAWRNNGDIEVIAGHQRLKASRSVGLKKVPVIILPFTDKETALTYNVADNKLAELTYWDMPTLKDVLEELDKGALDVQLTGFDTDEIKDLMSQFNPTEEEFPEKKKGVTQQVSCPECDHIFVVKGNEYDG